MNLSKLYRGSKISVFLYKLFRNFINVLGTTLSTYNNKDKCIRLLPLITHFYSVPIYLHSLRLNVYLINYVQ